MTGCCLYLLQLLNFKKLSENDTSITIKKRFFRMKTLIADSGSTKTDWCIAEGGQAIARATTQGINPIHQSDEQIGKILNDELDDDFLRQAEGGACSRPPSSLPMPHPSV